MGPEGGQFAIFFEKGDPFDFKYWQTPAVIDTEPFDIVSKTKTQAAFRKKASLTNFSGTAFEIQIDRIIKLLNTEQAAKLLKIIIPDSVNVVCYESDNKITNISDQPWKKETGLLSIWILGMFKHSPETTVVIPFVSGSDDQLGQKVNDEYFGKVPADRLIVKDDVLFFKADGQFRSKIGLSPQRAKPIAGSYDAAGNTLTLVQYTKPAGATDYVNSMWQLQDKPYAGDVVNSYNDGPAEPGKEPLGPFYELETSSPVNELQPDESLSHIHRTYHIQGSQADLDAIAKETLGVSIDQIKNAFE
jgi:hypothetical protein